MKKKKYFFAFTTAFFFFLGQSVWAHNSGNRGDTMMRYYSHKVQGIPTKFKIDKNGNIRFRFTGFSGGEPEAVEEVSAMIEMAQNVK
ncbi:MAG TPA: hypothetical protein VNS32_27575 [Flavisolibacter sp.]|nr:hypothetical protein [Flavisolibacter sp.]